MTKVAWMRAAGAIVVALTTAACTGKAVAEPPFVHEVTMAAPDIVRVEVREARVQPGKIIPLGMSRPEERGSWIRLSSGESGTLIGPKRDHLRVGDTVDLIRLDRKTVDQASGYGPLGPRKIVGVYRKSVPWSSGRVISGNKSAVVASFRHFIHLKLDAALPPGNYVVTWPDKLLPPTPFTFDDKTTRASSIRANQVGHRADDVAKYAYLVQWLPNGPDDGAVDFRQYGLKEFNIIDDKGEVVFSKPIAFRLGPKDPETAHGGHGVVKTHTREDGSTFNANRTGTYLFGLDYSSWRAARPGIYRLQIPTLGVSDPFSIDDEVWLRAARASMAGLYHQRSGIAIDGRFGYTQPECYTQASGVTVQLSKLPVVFAKGKSDTGLVNFQEAFKSPWITSESLPNAWGGYLAAGDWQRAVIHLTGVSYVLLDLFELLPPDSRNVDFGIPATGTVLRDPMYAGKDFPDLIDEALWNLDFARRVQRPDGAVVTATAAIAGPRSSEPCWLESQPVVAFAPDPETTFKYAFVAAKAAIVLQQLGESHLSLVYRESALRAWDWADRMLAEPAQAFAEVRSLSGIPDAEFESRLKPIIESAQQARFSAAAALYRLTAEDRFGRLAHDRFRQWYGAPLEDGAWEYSLARWPDANSKVRDNIRRGIVVQTRRIVVAPQLGALAYRTMQRGVSGLGWGSGVAPRTNIALRLMRAHAISGDQDFLATMQAGSAHILGANQVGMSFTTGLGVRPPLAPLHNNSIAAGVPPPAGITIYGWVTPGVMSMYRWLWWPATAPLAEDAPEKRVEPAPARSAMPTFEFLIEYPWLIMSAEFTIHQTIATTAVVWAYLHAHRRNPETHR